MNRLILFTIFLWGVASIVSAQNKKHRKALKDTEWEDGRIVLIDGSELLGFVKYNTKTGLLSFKNDEGSTSYTAKSVASFNFLDLGKNKQRQFYSLLYNDPKINVEKPFFFEVLAQFKTFALLSKIDPMELTQKSTPGTMSPNGSFTPGISSEVITQDETLFFADDKGSISPYLKISKTDDRTEKVKVIDRSSLSKHTEPYYDRLLNFSEKEKLRFDEKEDLILILAHYKVLLEDK
jgi:hypothetical protein